MRVVEESVENGVAEGGISDGVVPVLDGDLAGDQRAAAGITVVEHLEEIVSSRAREGSEPPVVEDEEPGSGEPLDELRVGSVRTGEGEFVGQTGDAVVAGRDADAAGLVAEGTGEVALPRPGGAAAENGLALPDPLPGGEAEHDGSIQSARGLEVEVFDGRVEVESGVALEAHVAALLPFGLLAFEEQGETSSKDSSLTSGMAVCSSKTWAMPESRSS